jgi:hypothetical protein
VEYERPFGGQVFVYITPDGRKVIIPILRRIWKYIITHPVEILTLIFAGATLWLTIQ